MVRRVSVPGADELFRRTGDEPGPPEPTQPEPTQPEAPTSAPVRRTTRGPRAAERARSGSQPDGRPDGRPGSQPSGRVRHDEKMTVYVTAHELTEIETARLTLRSQHGLVVDRGRLVREAIAMALAELEAEGEASRLVRRLSE